MRVLFCGYLDIAQIWSITDVSAQHVMKQAEVRTALEKRDKVLSVRRSQPAGVGPKVESVLRIVNYFLRFRLRNHN